MSEIGAITLYATKPSVGDFDDLIDPARLAEAGVHDFDGVDEDDREWSARLYLWPGEERPPPWLAFLQQGFGDAVSVPDTAQSRAVLAIRVFFRRDRFFALTFGAGRFQLRRGVTEPAWGLRTALNGIYGGDADAAPAERIRQVETRTVAANTFRTVRQANRSADFDAFGHDSEADQLNAIVGRPVPGIDLGSQVKGGASLRLARRSTFEELGKLCRALASLHEKTDYRRRFSFVDSFRPIADTSRIAALDEMMLEGLVAEPEKWQIAPPGVIDFDRFDQYRLRLPELEPFMTSDPTLEQIAGALEDAGAAVTAEVLSRGKIEALDEDGGLVDAWSLRSALDGQIEQGEQTLLLEGGEYFVIQPDYLARLNDFVDGIEESDVDLPDSERELVGGEHKEIPEGDYNEIAADHSDEHLLLDKKTVTIPGKTSSIEICDVLTLNRELVHVKRKFSSSSLSHLFAQGYVSSDLLVGSRDYRMAVRKQIGGHAAAFRDLFDPDDIAPSDFEVVYAIVGDWGAKQLRDIPFFSKVNLRRHASALRRFGFRVTHAKVRVVDP